MNDSGRKQLDNAVRKEVTKMFEAILDYADIAVPEKGTFKALRSKILRVGNDCIRTLSTELKEYKVEYIERDEDIIEVKNN